MVKAEAREKRSKPGVDDHANLELVRKMNALSKFSGGEKKDSG